MTAAAVQLLGAEMGGVRELDIWPGSPYDLAARGVLDVLRRMTAVAIARGGGRGQMRADLFAAMAGGAFGMARQGGLDLVAMQAVGAETSAGIDPGPRIHMARVRELGEKLSFVAGIRE